VGRTPNLGQNYFGSKSEETKYCYCRYPNYQKTKALRPIRLVVVDMQTQLQVDMQPKQRNPQSRQQQQQKKL
jgi:hypothetical protein